MLVVQETLRHQAAIAGSVKDSQTGQPIAGALVRITTGPAAFIEPFVNQFVILTRSLPLAAPTPAAVTAARAVVNDAQAGAPARFTAAQTVMEYLPPGAALPRPDQVRTRADGHYHYLDLPEGQYTLTVAWPSAGARYGVASAQATVARTPEGKLTLAVADVALPPTTVQGTITNGNAAPVRLAEVRIKGSGEQTYSQAQGQYRLSGIEAGSRTLIVSARGYETATQTVKFDQPGTVQTVNLTLRPVAP